LASWHSPGSFITSIVTTKGEIMCYQDQIPNVFEAVSAMNIPDEFFVRTLTDEAKMLSGRPPDEILEDQLEAL
jgi:hypothetical protein